MQILTLRLAPLSAFGTPLLGDTLFGQLCWAVRNRCGEARLEELLRGYTQGLPFAVVSNAFPAGFVPLPVVPFDWFKVEESVDRKAAKSRKWLPLTAFGQPLQDWLTVAQSPAAVMQTKCSQQPHNSINRQTGTTGHEGFSPYSMAQEWFPADLVLECHVVLDVDRFTQGELLECLGDIGAMGYGRDASIGLGKFEILGTAEAVLPAPSGANACLTLAPCAPQGLSFDPRHSFYTLFTRFGRHGDQAVHQAGRPFKNPVLMAAAGAVFKTLPPAAGFIGQGLGGSGQLSNTISATVQQGYCPIIPISLPLSGEDTQ